MNHTEQEHDEVQQIYIRAIKRVFPDATSIFWNPDTECVELTTGDTCLVSETASDSELNFNISGAQVYCSLTEAEHAEVDAVLHQMFSQK